MQDTITFRSERNLRNVSGDLRARMVRGRHFRASPRKQLQEKINCIAACGGETREHPSRTGMRRFAVEFLGCLESRYVLVLDRVQAFP